MGVNGRSAINSLNPKGTANAMKTPGRQAQLPDVYPQDGSGALRWPDGTIWVPVLKRSGLFGRITRRDRRHYAAAMESQLIALERAVEHHREELASRPLLETGTHTRNVAASDTDHSPAKDAVSAADATAVSA